MHLQKLDTFGGAYFMSKKTKAEKVGNEPGSIPSSFTNNLILSKLLGSLHY